MLIYACSDVYFLIYLRIAWKLVAFALVSCLSLYAMRNSMAPKHSRAVCTNTRVHSLTL